MFLVYYAASALDQSNAWYLLKLCVFYFHLLCKCDDSKDCYIHKCICALMHRLLFNDKKRDCINISFIKFFSYFICLGIYPICSFNKYALKFSPGKV